MATMHGKGKARIKCNTTKHKTTQEVDSSEDDEMNGIDDERRRRESAKLDRGKILAAIDLMRHPNRLPAVFNDVVRQQWQEWHDAVPTSLHDVPTSEFVLSMPRKCNPMEEAEATVTAPRQQIELLTFCNEGGSELQRTKKNLERTSTALMQTTLVEEDLPIDSTVALTRGEGDTSTALPGDGTPFFVGDVKRLELLGNSIDKPPLVGRVLVHFRMPYAKKGFVDDPNKPWLLACLCRQEYNRSHERWLTCKARKEEAPCSLAENTTQYLDWFPVDRVFETKLKLNHGKTLHMETKRRLVETNATWKGQLKIKD